MSRSPSLSSRASSAISKSPDVQAALAPESMWSTRLPASVRPPPNIASPTPPLVISVVPDPDCMPPFHSRSGVDSLPPPTTKPPDCWTWLATMSSDSVRMPLVTVSEARIDDPPTPPIVSWPPLTVNELSESMAPTLPKPDPNVTGWPVPMHARSAAPGTRSPVQFWASPIRPMALPTRSARCSSAGPPCERDAAGNERPQYPIDRPAQNADREERHGAEDARHRRRRSTSPGEAEPDERSTAVRHRLNE